MQIQREDKGRDQINPFAIYFPTGFQPNGGPSWEVQSSNNDGLQEHVLIGRSEHVDFVGHSAGDVANIKPCRYAIGVIDRANKKMRFADVEHGEVLRVEARAHCLKYDAQATGVEEGDLSRIERYAQTRRLVDAFGSTRRKRQLTERQQAAVQAETIASPEAVKTMLQDAGDRAKELRLTKQEIIDQATGQRNLPPHNPAATSPQEAYRLDELVPAQLADVLDSQSLDTLLRDTQQQDATDEFLKLANRKQNEAGFRSSPQHKRGVLYLKALLQMRKFKDLNVHAKKGGMRSVADRFQIDVEILRAIAQGFYTEFEEGMRTRYARTEAQSNLMLMHIMILTLALEGYSMGATICDALRQALQITPSMFSQMYRELGCVVKLSARKSDLSSKQRDMLVVLMPATMPPKALAEYFPQIKTGGKKGR